MTTLRGGFAPQITKPSELRGLSLHFDCASGAAGDMMLGALIDLGVPVEIIGDALDAIGAGRHRLAIARVIKGGISAVDVKVDTSEPPPVSSQRSRRAASEPGSPGSPPIPSVPKRAATEPGAPRRAATEPAFVAIKFRAETHSRHVHVNEHGDKTEEVHEHVEVAHYHYADIRRRLETAKLLEGTRRRALDIFDWLARAEAKLHGTTVGEVTFHEVGAIDSIVDIVGTAAALDWLSPTSVTCASVAMGQGTVQSAHGVLPVPAPAALEVLREAGGVMASGGVSRELCTPTGAAILADTVSDWTAAPPGRAIAVGWGAGDADLADRANVVRVVALAPTEGAAETIWQIDANLDDMSPELCTPAAEALFELGALDVWWTPIMMKKGRPALTISVLADGARRDAVIAAVLRETTTIGVRYTQMLRTVLARRTIEVETRFGRIPVKLALDGEHVVNAAPEYEACAAAARDHGVPAKLVYAAALAAYDARS